MVLGYFGPFQTDMDNFEASMRAVTLGGIVLIGALLCCLIICLVTMVASLTFSCWWTLGSFFKVGASASVAHHPHRCFFPSSRQKLLLRHSSDIGTNDGKCQQKLSSASIWLYPASPTEPAVQPPPPHKNGVAQAPPLRPQRVLLNDELEALTAVV